MPQNYPIFFGVEKSWDIWTILNVCETGFSKTYLVGLSILMFPCWQIVTILIICLEKFHKFSVNFCLNKISVVEIGVNYFGKLKCIILVCWQAASSTSAAAEPPNPGPLPTLMPIDSKTSAFNCSAVSQEIDNWNIYARINISDANSLVCKQTYGAVECRRTHIYKS